MRPCNVEAQYQFSYPNSFVIPEITPFPNPGKTEF